MLWSRNCRSWNTNQRNCWPVKNPTFWSLYASSWLMPSSFCFSSSSELNGLRSSLTDGAMKERLKTLAVEVRRETRSLFMQTVTALYCSLCFPFSSSLSPSFAEQKTRGEVGCPQRRGCPDLGEGPEENQQRLWEKQEALERPKAQGVWKSFWVQWETTRIERGESFVHSVLRSWGPSWKTRLWRRRISWFAIFLLCFFFGFFHCFTPPLYVNRRRLEWKLTRMLGLTSRTPCDPSAPNWKTTKHQTQLYWKQTKNCIMDKSVLSLQGLEFYERLKSFTGFWFWDEESVVLQL